MVLRVGQVRPAREEEGGYDCGVLDGKGRDVCFEVSGSVHCVQIKFNVMLATQGLVN